MNHAAPLAARKSIPDYLYKYLTMAFVTLLIILRDTRYFTQPRFWAEEGTLHFTYSFSYPGVQALFQPQVGYLNFWPNLATLLATLVPLQNAPLITTLLALVVQLLPVALILWSGSSLWQGWTRKLLGIAVVLFTPLTSEVWLNTINSFTFLATVTFLILLEEPSASTGRRWIYRILLVLGGLTGTLSSFLIPFFLLRAYFDQNKERWLQAALLTVCALIQVILIFSYRDNASFGQRFHLIGLTTFGVTMWTQSLALFAVGFERVDEWARALFSLTVQDLARFQLWGRFLLAAGAGLLLLLSTNLSWKRRILFIGSYLVLMLLPMMFSVISDKYTLIDTGLHQRLFLAPNILLGWMLLAGVRFQREKGWRASISNLVSLLCCGLVGASLLWGIQTYRQPWFINEYWPDWKAEVAAWRANPDYSLHIQPEGWVVRLPQR